MVPRDPVVCQSRGELCKAFRGLIELRFLHLSDERAIHMSVLPQLQHFLEFYFEGVLHASSRRESTDLGAFD